MSTPLIRLWYAITALVISCFVIAFVSVQYANWTREQTIEEMRSQQERSDQRWCELLRTLDDGYKAQPPGSPTGQKIAADIARLRQQFGCGTNQEPKGD